MKAIHVTLATLAVGALLFAAPSCSDKDEIDPVENPPQNYEPVDESTIAKATIAKKVVGGKLRQVYQQVGDILRQTRLLNRLQEGWQHRNLAALNLHGSRHGGRLR